LAQARDEETRGRFKCMCVVGDWDAAGMPANLRGWNGKPVLITKTGETFAGTVRQTSNKGRVDLLRCACGGCSALARCGVIDVVEVRATWV
jgi:hypothetical protein